MTPFQLAEGLTSAEQLLPPTVEGVLSSDVPYGYIPDLFTRNHWDTSPQSDDGVAEAIPNDWSPTAKRRLAYMALQAGRIEAVSSLHGAANDEAPDIQICLPLPIARGGSVESAENVVGLIARASENVDRTDVLIWANASGQDASVAEKRHGELLEAIKPLNSEHHRLSVAYTITTTARPVMTRIRHDMMAAITHKHLRAPNAFRLPVLWLDDDVLHLSDGAIGDMRTELLSENASPFVHYDLDHTIESPGHELDAAAKVVLMHELLVRMEKNVVKQSGHTYKYGYDEESGLGFMLGSYWLAHGVGLDQEYGQTSSLVRGYKHYVRPGRPEYRIAQIGGLNSDKISGTKLVEYIDARMVANDRRTYELVKKLGPYGTRDRHQAGQSGYQLYSHMCPGGGSLADRADLGSDEVANYFGSRIAHLPAEDQELARRMYRLLYGRELSS